MVRWIAAAFPILLCVPFSAGAAEHCPHGQTHAIRHVIHAEAVENVPAPATASSCPEHEGTHAINAGTMPKCAMEGCCIKSDGPRSAGLSSRPPVSDHSALGVSVNRFTLAARRIVSAPDRFRPLRDRAEPALHPPSTPVLS